MRERDPPGRAVTFEFNADAFNSNSYRGENKYTAERILSDKPGPSTPGGRLYKAHWKCSAAWRGSCEHPSSFVPRYTSV